MDKPCQFCGSKTRLISTEYYSHPDDQEPAKTVCCKAQKRNIDFIRSRYDPRDTDIPNLDDVDDYDLR